MNLAKRIQRLRKQNGFSQEELAEKIGVTRQAVSKWESEQSAPDMDNIITLSDLFDVTTDYLLKGKENIIYSEKNNFENLLKKEIPDLIIFISSVLNLIGVVTGYNWMKIYRDSRSFFSFIFIFSASFLFIIAKRFFDEKIKENKVRYFMNINIWLYAAYSWCYFEFISNIIPPILSAIIHFIICIIIIIPINLKSKEKNPNKKLKKYIKTYVVFSIIQIIIAISAIIAFFILMFGGEEIKSFIPALVFAIFYLIKGIKGLIDGKTLL